MSDSPLQPLDLEPADDVEAAASDWLARRVTYGKDTRRAVLEHGEAYFQITHDASRPFTVETGNHRVTDIWDDVLIR